MGVVVSDTSSDTPIATERSTANSRNNRPTIPPISRIGMKTATSDTLMERTVKPISLAPRNAASIGFIPSSRWREMFSMTTIASSTTKPVAMVSAIRERLSMLYPNRYITPNVPTSETGTATLGMSVARGLRRNRNTTRMTSPMEMASVISTSCTEARMVVLRSMTDAEPDWPAGSPPAVAAEGSARGRRYR